MGVTKPSSKPLDDSIGLSLVCLVRSRHANPGPIVIDARNALCIVAELSLGEVARIVRVSRNLS